MEHSAYRLAVNSVEPSAYRLAVNSMEHSTYRLAVNCMEHSAYRLEVAPVIGNILRSMEPGVLHRIQKQLT